MGETNLCSYSMEGDHPTKKEMVHTSNYHGMWRSQSLHSYSSTYDASLMYLIVATGNVNVKEMAWECTSSESERKYVHIRVFSSFESCCSA